MGAETIVPVALGALAYRFEKAGIKGVSSAIKGMAPSAKKTLIQVLNASGKEGMTEFAQGVVESFNSGLGKKGNIADASAEVAEFWEKDALETFLQGAVGGGVSAGGGRALRRAASTVRSAEAERAITETTEKIAALDEKLNDPIITKAEKVVLNRTRTALKNKMEKAIKEPNKIVRKLSDESIDKITKKSNDNDRLRRELKESRQVLDDDAYSIVEEDINDRLQSNYDSIQDVIDNVGNENIRAEDGT